MRSRYCGPLKDIAAASGPDRGDFLPHGLGLAGAQGSFLANGFKPSIAVSISSPDQIRVLPMTRTGEGVERDVSCLLRLGWLVPLAGHAPRGLRDPAPCFLAALPMDAPSAGAAEAQ